MDYRTNEDWLNWSQSIQIKPERIYTPRNLDELVDIVQTAQRNGKRVRAIGSGWSFSDVVATNDYLVETDRLSGVVTFSQGTRSWVPGNGSATFPEDSPVLPEALTDAVRRSDRKLVHLLAGTKIKDVYLALDRPSGGRSRWALRTMGGASGQSLAGAISTGTHGGDFNDRPIADMVQAIHLVAPDGSQHWIERAGSSAITDRARLAGGLRGVSGEHIHYDDDWFNSILVSMGTLGIIYAYVIEARDQFGLSEDRRETTWADLKPMLASGEIFTSTRYSERDPDRRWIDHHPAAADRRPKGLGIFINPYRKNDDYSDGGTADRDVVLITHAESGSIDGAHSPTGGASVFDLFHIIKDFESAGNLSATRAVVDRVIASLRQNNGTEGNYRVAYSVLDTTTDTGSQPVLSLEIAVTTVGNRHVEFIDRMLVIFDGIMRDRWARGIKAKFAGGINLRYTRPTEAYLGMSHGTADAADDERFCHIEVIVAREQWATGRPLWGEGSDYTNDEMENFTEDFTDAFERATDNFDARLHWGQLSRTNRFDPDRYPKFGAWLEVHNTLTGNSRIGTFENDWSHRHLSPQRDVAFRGPNGKLVAAEGGGGRELIANRDHRREWETFKLIEFASNRVALRAHSGHYVSTGNGQELVANESRIGGSGILGIIRIDDDRAVLRTRNGMFVRLDSSGKLVANGRAINDETMFEVVDAARPTPETPVSVRDQFWPPVFAEDSRSGIGSYDLANSADRVLAFDYGATGNRDHLLLYRPGKGIVYIVRRSGGNAFTPVFTNGRNGIGGYDLASSADRAFAFDYESAGNLDHIAFYRPGKGIMWILRRDDGNAFTPVFTNGGNGIGGYDLASSADRAFAFDYGRTGKMDHIVLYRPGNGIIWILKHNGANFERVFASRDGIGGYDLSSTADRAFAFDYQSSGRLDHIVLYRPGKGNIWILKRNDGGAFERVFESRNGIGGYDLTSSADRAFAFDCESTGNLDHITLYRPGKGIMWVLRRSHGGEFERLFTSRNGIGGYDIASPADRAIAFDYDGSGRMDHIALYRPGEGIVRIVRKQP